MDEELKDYYVPQIFRKVFCEHSKEQPRERGRKDRMKKIGFDNDKYLKMQSEHIRERIGKFGGKLYLEFGGKLFDDYHASRVLPGFEPDSKLRLLKELSDQAEIVFAISAKDIEKNKIRGDLGITYDSDVIRLIGTYREQGLFVGSVVITQFSGQESALLFKHRLEKLNIPVYIHYNIPGYPANIPLIVSDEGYGKNDYIETSHPLVIVTAPGPGSGKMAVCLSQLYQDHQRGIDAGYAKFETFPIWNLPLKHPVNLAYEAATADLNDVNMIDPFHLEAYGETTVNYNRDVEIFPVLDAIFEKIYGENPYKSPTDMGVNMVGNCICDDEVCQEASKQEIIRRYYSALNRMSSGDISEDEVFKIGIFNKPHGVKGEISFTFTDDIFDRVECEYLVCLLDGIFVPFFIEEYRFRSDTTALVKLEGVDTSEKARMFTNVEVYFPKKYVGEEEDSDDIPTWNYFIGFKVEDVNHGELGEIVAVDDSTMNVLFAIEKDGEELLLPAHEEFIIKLDKKKRLLTVEVPDGLI